MSETEAPSKATLRANVSVSIAVSEIEVIDDAAYRTRQSRARFIRTAAIEAAKVVVAVPKEAEQAAV